MDYSLHVQLCGLAFHRGGDLAFHSRATQMCCGGGSTGDAEMRQPNNCCYNQKRFLLSMHKKRLATSP